MTQGHICDLEDGIWCATCQGFFAHGSVHAMNDYYARVKRCTICGLVTGNGKIYVYGKVSAMSEDHPQVSERLARVEIDDVMVERAWTTLNEQKRTGFHGRLAVKRALDAALNPPPPEPEIPVTHTMLDAGYNAWGENRIPVARTSGNERWMADIYRAMRKLEPKP